MSRQLLLVNVALAALAVVSVGYIVRELRTPVTERPRRPAPAAPPATAPPPSTTSETPSGGYAVVASRNLFSPTRSEAPPSPVAAAPQLPKPNLYGIILRDGAPVAYLEDPTTKRVAGYRLGDAVAGGTVKQIGADHVVLNRPEGDVNVRLRDPAKPKPAAPAAAGTPGAPPQPGAGSPIPTRPGVPTPPSAQATPGTPIQPGMPSQPAPAPQPSTTTPQPPQILPRRPLPPNLLRRLPPPPASDAPAQQ